MCRSSGERCFIGFAAQFSGARSRENFWHDIISPFRQLANIIDRDAFSVLMLLSKGGATRDVLDEVLERLLQHKNKRKESIVATFFFADKIMVSEEDGKYIRRKREMLKDSLQDSRLYKELYAEAQEEALEKGLERGLEKGRLEEVRKIIESFVEETSPVLLSGVKEQMQQITDLAVLHTILHAVRRASTEDEIKAAFSLAQ